MLLCADGTLYTGVSTDVQRRVLEHNSKNKGAKYTKPRQPVTLVYSQRLTNRSKAQIKEAALKKLKREEKLLLIHKPRQKGIL